MPESQMFPRCCGLAIGTEFYRTSDFRNLAGLQDVNIEDYGVRFSSILVLNGRQKKQGHKLLAKQGYKIIQTFYNPRHASVCYVYFKDEHPTFNPTSPRFNKTRYYKAIDYDGYETIRIKSDDIWGKEAYPRDWRYEDAEW